MNSSVRHGLNAEPTHYVLGPPTLTNTGELRSPNSCRLVKLVSPSPFDTQVRTPCLSRVVPRTRNCLSLRQNVNFSFVNRCNNQLEPPKPSTSHRLGCPTLSRK